MLSFVLQILATFVVSLIAFSAVFFVAIRLGYISFRAAKPSVVDAKSAKSAEGGVPFLVVATSISESSSHPIVINVKGECFDAGVYASASPAFLFSFESEMGKNDYIGFDAKPRHSTVLAQKIITTVLSGVQNRARASSPNTQNLFAIP